MLNCRQMTELVTDYLEDRMPWRDRFRFQLHLGMCRHCRAYLRQMRRTLRALGSLPPAPLPREVREDLLRRFRDWTP